MKALIDGDVIVYQGGFASDQTSYNCPDGYNTRYKKDAVEYCKTNNLSTLLITKQVTAEPIEFCLSSIKKMLNSIKDKIDATEHLVLLTGKGNFREKIFTEYKANRDRTHRPTHYEEIRTYLKEVWKADEVVGVEADDALGWHQWQDFTISKGDQLSGESCICTIDKDLNQIPGWHFNWRSNDGDGDMYWVTPEQSIRFFFEQWLSGDAADNIPGLPKVGEKTARKSLDTRFGNGSDGTWPEAHDYYDFITDCYMSRAPHYEPSFVNTIGDLLWMQRHPGETWDVYLELTQQRRGYETKKA